MSTNADLLKSLKIDRSTPPPPESRKGLWIGLAVAGAILLAAIAGWLLFGRDDAIEVRTAEVTAIGGGGTSSASVLDATGYVVARRMATVSAKIPGKVREVLIEEGQRVEEGEVIATLDPVDADQQYPAAILQLDDFTTTAGILVSSVKGGTDPVALANEIARRCNNWKEPQ